MTRFIFVRLSKDTVESVDVGPLDDDAVRDLEAMVRAAPLEQRRAFVRLMDVLRSQPRG